jgi:hypothetical protein
MPQMVADAYLTGHVGPMAGGVLRDTAQPQSFRVLVNTLFGQIYRKEVLYEAMPAYYPGKKDETFHVDYNKQERKPVLYGFVPALIDFERDMSSNGFTSKQIAVLIAAMYAHEEIHIRLGVGAGAKYPLEARLGKYDVELAKKEEAEAWGITILEVFRPILRRGGKLPQNWVGDSEKFKEVNDNYADPCWINAFASRVE